MQMVELSIKKFEAFNHYEEDQFDEILEYVEKYISKGIF